MVELGLLGIVAQLGRRTPKFVNATTREQDNVGF